MKSVLNHTAFLVPNVVKSAEYLRQFDFKVGRAEKWDGEGTLEIYVGDLTSEGANLLLMEPVTEGAYSRAMAKRGPGLHHIAIDVLDLESYIDGLSGSDWFLHSKSLKIFSSLGLNQIQTCTTDELAVLIRGKNILFKDFCL